MSYKYSKGPQVIGDLKAADDTERNTLIDFGEDYIGFETSGSLRMKISGSDGSITFNEAFTFPISDGSADQVLKTNGSGQLSWATQSGGSSGGTGVGIEYATGHVDLTTNNKPVNWVNASSISAASGIKSWFIVPKDTTIDKVIVSVKGNNFNTSNDGNVTLSIYKNQADYGSTIVNQTVGADDFSEKVSNMAGGTTDCNQKIFSGLNQSVSEGDLIHIKVGKSSGSDKEALVTIVFDSGGGVTIPYPRLYFSGISAVSQIGNNSFTNATISTDNGKYENGFIDFGSSGNTAPARFESEIPLLGGIYTFSFWFYSKRTGSDWGAILRRESGGSPVNTQDYPIVTEDSTDELGVYTESGGQFYSSGYDMTSLEGTTSWTHMAVVANGTNSKFYINGSLVGTANAVVTTSVKELGAYDGNDTQVFAEGIDDFAHWAETLSADQISEIYNSSSKLRDIVT